jgi:hypothetical protein
MTHLLRSCVLACLVAVSVTVSAHGDWPPKHGGQMNDGGETSFELVAKGHAVVFFVEDHGTPMPMQGSAGTLTLTRSDRQWTVDVVPGTGNQLSARLPHRLQPGDRLLVKVALANRSVVAGRFVIR